MGKPCCSAGLISDQDQRTKSGIPVLNDIDVIGNLFGTKSGQKQRTEIIMFIKPHLIRNSVDARSVAEEFRARLEMMRDGRPFVNGEVPPIIKVMIDAQETIVSGEDLRPNLAVLLSAGGAVALISTMSLPLPIAIASSLLGALMIAGAEVDARTYLLPDTVTWGGITLGILAAPVLNPFEPWLSAGAAVVRAAGTALALVLLRWGYGWLRSREGLGLGDVKLAAAVGAWLPVAFIPFCFALATCAALITVMFGRLRGESVDATAKLPFGAFLCPALWLVFYTCELPG